MTTTPDYYEVLQVSPKADAEVIQAAYKRLVEKWQTTRTTGDTSAFAKLATLDEAYTVLSDPQKRVDYDSRLRIGTPRGRHKNNPLQMAVQNEPGLALRRDIAEPSAELTEEIVAHDSAVALQPAPSEKPAENDTATSRQSMVWLAVIAVVVVLFGLGYGLLNSGRNPHSPEGEKLPASDLRASFLADGFEYQSLGVQKDPTANPPLTPDALFSRSSQAVVSVVVEDRYGRIISRGSGFLVSTTGLIATNHHVIENAHTVRLILADGRSVPVLGIAALEQAADIVILQSSGWNGTRPLTLAAGDDLPPVGVKVYAIGNPLGLANTLSDGLISGHRILDKITEIQTTAPISPGSSGGPLLGIDGRVVGVTTFLVKGGQNLNFAVPVAHVARLLRQCDVKVKQIRFGWVPIIEWFATVNPNHAWASALLHRRQKVHLELDEVLRHDPTNVQAYIDRGCIWYWRTDLDPLTRKSKSIQDLSQAIRLDPKNSESYLARGFVYWELLEREKAMADFESAIAHDPTCPGPHFYRALTWQAKDQDKALREYNELVRLLPNDAACYRERASFYVNHKTDYDLAILDYDTAIRIDPQDVHSYTGRARVWRDKRDYDKAIRDFEEAIRLRPEYGFTHQYLADLLASCPDERVRDGKRAIQLATKACELSFAGYDFFEHATLAAAYAETGQFAEAERYQAKALECVKLTGALREQYRQRLELYKQKKPFRDDR